MILLSIVAALLIIISLLNYILIVISSMVKRSKEVGVRKCYGAEGKHIYGILTKEALLHILLSLVIAAIIIFAGRGIVENLLGVPFQTLLVSQSIMAIAAVLLFVLVISIVVPAELYQRIPVYAALKNYTENSRRWKLGLLGVQVLINVFLVGKIYTSVSGCRMRKIKSGLEALDFVLDSTVLNLSFIYDNYILVGAVGPFKGFFAAGFVDGHCGEVFGFELHKFFRADFFATHNIDVVDIDICCLACF